MPQRHHQPQRIVALRKTHLNGLDEVIGGQLCEFLGKAGVPHFSFVTVEEVANVLRELLRIFGSFAIRDYSIADLVDDVPNQQIDVVLVDFAVNRRAAYAYAHAHARVLPGGCSALFKALEH